MERFYMTNKGLEYVSKTATGSILKFTQGKFGNGSLSGTVTDLTELVNPLGTMPISKSSTNGNQITIQTQFSNKVDGTILSPFYLKEIGLFAKLLNSDGTDNTEYPETLVAYAYVTGTDQGDRIPGILTEFIINWPCTVGNAENVQVEISSMAYAKEIEFQVVKTLVETEMLKKKFVDALPSSSREYTFDTETAFTAVERCSLSIATDKYLTVTTASNAGNKYALAQLSFASISTNAKIFVIEMDTRIPASRWYISLVDLAKRPGTSQSITYDTTGVAFMHGTKDGSNYHVNGNKVMNSGFADTWLHTKTIVDMASKKVNYEITDRSTGTVLSSNTVDFKDSETDKITGIELYSYTQTTIDVDNVKVTAGYGIEENVLYIVGTGGIYDTYIYRNSEPILISSQTTLAELNAAKHTHDNKTVLDGITADKVLDWDDNSVFLASFYNDNRYITLQEIADAIDSKSNANIKKNPKSTGGDIIDTHLTVGTRASSNYGVSSVSIGSENKVTQEHSCAIGMSNEVNAPTSAVVGGSNNTASGISSAVVGGSNNTASGQGSAVIGGVHVKTNNEAEVAIGKYNSPSNTTLFTIGNGTSDDNRSNAFSVDDSGNGVFTNSLTSGYRSGTVGERSFVSGGGDGTGGSIPNEASGVYSATVGGDCNTASAMGSAVLGGCENTASGTNATVVGGDLNTASGVQSAVIGGVGNTALSFQVKTGHYAKDGTGGIDAGTTGDAFTIGNGTSSAKSNCFRVGYDGYVYGGKTFAANSADNAHFYEWQDGNPNNEDRRGLFVTLDGAKIRIATPEDTYIKGVVSAQPSFVSNAYSDNWQGMYLKDIFGAYLTDENGNYIINPDYDPEKEYIPRENRPEWDWVTNDGDIVLVDDGTCEVNGFATVGVGGKATKANTKTNYRVMERKDDTHIYVSVG